MTKDQNQTIFLFSPYSSPSSDPSKTYFETLDIDLYAKKQQDKHHVKQIINKIKRLPCCKGIWAAPSNFKGYHIKIYCQYKNCEICRFVYDDPNRYRKDLQRIKATRNVLFTTKNKTLNIPSTLIRQIQTGEKQEC